MKWDVIVDGIHLLVIWRAVCCLWFLFSFGAMLLVVIVQLFCKSIFVKYIVPHFQLNKIIRVHKSWFCSLSKTYLDPQKYFNYRTKYEIQIYFTLSKNVIFNFNFVVIFRVGRFDRRSEEWGQHFFFFFWYKATFSLIKVNMNLPLKLNFLCIQKSVILLPFLNYKIEFSPYAKS